MGCSPPHFLDLYGLMMSRNDILAQLSLRPSVVMDGKVSITRFNAPAGDTFQAISLAGGHVISIKYILLLTFLLPSYYSRILYNLHN